MLRCRQKTNKLAVIPYIFRLNSDDYMIYLMTTIGRDA